MDVVEFEAELVRIAEDRHQKSMDETSHLLEQVIESSNFESDGRRDVRYPRHAICTRVHVPECDKMFAPIGRSETGMTQNISAGGVSIIVPHTPEFDVLLVEFPIELIPYTLILKLLLKRPAGQLTECGGAFIGRG